MNQLCQLCNHNANRVYKDFPAYQEGEVYDIFYCDNCDTSFASPMKVDKMVYHNIYLHGKDVPGYNRYFRFAEDVKKVSDPLHYLTNVEDVYWGVNKFLVDNFSNQKNIDILEVGCGLGYLTYALRKKGYNAYGLDISEEAVNNAKKNYGMFYIHKDIFEFSRSSKKKYDAIILTEVIEHVENPVIFIRCLLELVKAGGKIMISTPDKIACLDTNEYWNTELPPVHLWWFSSKSFKFIAEQLDCKISYVNLTEFYKYITAPKLNNYKPWRQITFNASGKLMFSVKESALLLSLKRYLIEFDLLSILRKLKFKFSSLSQKSANPTRICVVFTKK